jgi:four helix bundle protein
MYLQLAHTNLPLFAQTRLLVLEVYKLTKLFPPEEKFALTQQMRRAAISVHLNLDEGCSRKSRLERLRFFEMAKGSAIEIDTSIEIASRLNFCTPDQSDELGFAITSVFKQVSGLLKTVQ